ncbi:hypothetical protein FS837_004652 [Tulasnella sp. UAMH 9824]|nr:hypothetical protein FS837_004652 [Tulasnella sp. UAMH 9824]
MSRVRSLLIKETDLEALVVATSTAPRLRRLAASNYHFALPTSLAPMLAAWAPSLRAIDIISCSFAWPNPGLSNLESIMIHCSATVTQLHQSQVLSILAASPALRQFCFTGTILADHSESQERAPTVHLHSLKTLHLDLQRSLRPLDLLNLIVASPTESFAYQFSADSEGVLDTDLVEIWPYVKKILDCETRLSLAATKELSRITAGQISITLWKGSERVEGKDNTPLFKAVLKKMSPAWLSSVQQLELKIDDEDVLHSSLLFLNDNCPNIVHIHLPHLNETWKSFLGRPAVNSTWKFPRLDRLSIFEWFEGGLLGILGQRKKAAQAGKITTGIKDLTICGDDCCYMISMKEREKFKRMGVREVHDINNNAGYDCSWNFSYEISGSDEE